LAIKGHCILELSGTGFNVARASNIEPTTESVQQRLRVECPIAAVAADRDSDGLRPATCHSRDCYTAPDWLAAQLENRVEFPGSILPPDRVVIWKVDSALN